jgi:hypothetical protein
MEHPGAVQSAEVSSITPAQIDASFIDALRLIDIGQAAVAVPILEGLYHQTKAIRIRLELARALAFSGRISEARALFIEIYKTNPPPAVKATILRFVDQIDLKRGKLNLGISVTKASNPLGQPAEVQLYFLGNPITLQLSQKDSDLWGLIFSGGYERTFTNGLDVRANASFQKMPNHPDVNMLVGDVSVGKQLADKPFELRVGAQFKQMNNQSYKMPYGEIGYHKAFTQRLEIHPRLQVGYYDFIAGSGLSGMNLRAATPVTYMFNPAMAVSIGPRIEVRDAHLPEQRYANAGLSVDAVMNFKQVNINTTIYPYITQFWRTDPFWGQKRFDKAVYVGTVISSDHVRIRGFLPTLNPFCSFNGSNIAFYRVKNCGFNIGVRKIF